MVPISLRFQALLEHRENAGQLCANGLQSAKELAGARMGVPKLTAVFEEPEIQQVRRC
jgi:hypothetical protein